MLKIQTGSNNKILRSICKEISKSDIGFFLKLGKQMIDYLKDPANGGIGLAAPQIGYANRIIAINLLKDRQDDSKKIIIMINPEILEYSKETFKDIEACLSLPGEKGEVERYYQIKVSFIDEHKKQKTLILKGLSSRIVQHEIDHLNGVLFTDYL